VRPTGRPRRGGRCRARRPRAPRTSATFRNGAVVDQPPAPRRPQQRHPADNRCSPAPPAERASRRTPFQASAARGVRAGLPAVPGCGEQVVDRVAAGQDVSRVPSPGRTRRAQG
jgi:hypothetical protein